MSQHPGKKMISVYVDEAVHREIRVYAAETGRTMSDICQPFADEYEQSAIKLVTQIKEMRKQAEIERIKKEEEAKIIAENPLSVSGHLEDPLGSLSVAQVAQ